MRLTRLALEGFGPYLRAQEIDFAAFDTDGLFAITGKTGAGKSTILDAICFALYDRVPRYDKAEPVLRSHFCGEDDPTEVTLDYELGTRRYRVWRSPAYARAKKRGSGTTVKPAEAKLYAWRDGDWEILAARPVEVAELIAATVPLTAAQFLQVILLAQGRFAEFLRADTSERRAVLRSLFGTQRFEDLELAIREAAKAAEASVTAADAQLGALVDRAAGVAGVDAPPAAARDAFWDDALAAASSTAAQASLERAAASERAEEAALALSTARAVEEARERLTRARETMLDLASRAEEHASRESRLSLARRAVPVVGPLAAVAHAETVEAESRAALERAREVAAADAAAGLAWPVAARAAGAGGETGDTTGAAGTLVEAGEDALRERASELSREIGEMAAAVTAEESLPALEAAHATALEAVAQSESARAATHTALAELPAREAELGEAKTAASAAAARVQDLKDAVERAQKAVAAHAELTEAAAALATATEDVARAAVAHQEAAAEHARLALGRLRSQAAHLAADLAPGEPCPVCGGTEHPSPAQPSDDHVTDAQVEAAFAQIAPREQRLAAARERHSEFDRLLAAARERAGEGDAAAADAALVEARAAHAAAVEAAAERERLTAELDALGARKTELTLALETQAEALERALARATEAATELEGARVLASRHPEGFESAVRYASALRSAKSLVESLAGATAAAEDAAATLARAREELAANLDAAGFATANEAREAALDPRELATLAQEVDAFREARAKAEGVVAELSERELPDEPADLDALSHAAAESARSRDAAIEAATGAAARLATLEALRAEYGALGEESATARAERDVVAVLADSLEGKAPNERRLRLESFVLASKLERIVAAANARLETMSSGQYRLEHDDQAQYRGKETGLALRIADSHTGKSRSTRSLSGGETFLASLALALGLAETVTAEAGGIELGTLFIDEGFGSLDGDTLEIAMSTLEDLRDSGRTVGLISHVEAMHDAIPARLEVEKVADGSSRVRTRVGQRADA